MIFARRLVVCCCHWSTNKLLFSWFNGFIVKHKCLCPYRDTFRYHRVDSICEFMDLYFSFFREHSESQPKSAEWGTKKSAVFKPKLELMTVNIDGVWCPMLLKFRSIWLLISHFALIYMFMVKKKPFTIPNVISQCFTIKHKQNQCEKENKFGLIWLSEWIRFRDPFD